MVNKTIIENVKDALAVSATIVESAKNEIVWILSPAMLIFSFQFGMPEKSKMLIENGGSVRGITQISGINLDPVRKLLGNGETVRHVDQYRGAFMLIADKQESISAINVADLSLDDPIVAFWTDDQAYADFLLVTFEAEWHEAVDAEKRLQEL